MGIPRESGKLWNASDETLRFLQKKLNITLPLFGTMIPDCRSCSTELADNQHSGPVENAFNEYLLTKAGGKF